MKLSEILIVTFIVLIFDIIWLSINKHHYFLQIQKVQNDSIIRINTYGAFLSYVCIIIGLLYYSVPLAKQHGKTFSSALRYGGLLGFVIYGVFNFTNMAIYKDYDMWTGMKDTLWGITLFTLSTWIIVYFDLI